MTLVAIDETTFEAAHIADERWNGFACPYFTRTEADKVAAWTVKLREEFGDDAELVTWDVSRNTFVGTSGGWEPGEAVLYPAVYLPGFTGPLFAIGAWAWTWQEVTHGEPVDEVVLAHPIRHEYAISGKPFWIVECGHPSHGPIALNSGHHYDSLDEAEQRAAEHNRTHGFSTANHGAERDDITLCRLSRKSSRVEAGAVTCDDCLIILNHRTEGPAS